MMTERFKPRSFEDSSDSTRLHRYKSPKKSHQKCLVSVRILQYRVSSLSVPSRSSTRSNQPLNIIPCPLTLNLSLSLSRTFP